VLCDLIIGGGCGLRVCILCLCRVHTRSAVSMTPQSETDSVDKSGRSTAATSAATGRSSRAGRDAKSYV